jgi:hypothetical protein
MLLASMALKLLHLGWLYCALGALHLIRRIRPHVLTVLRRR